MSLVWIRTLCQRLIAAPCSERVFPGEQVLELWPLMSPKRSTIAPVPTTVAHIRDHHKRRLANVPDPDPAGIIHPKLQQPYSRAYVLKPLPPKSVGPNEAVGHLGRGGHQNYPHRWKRGGTRSGDRTQTQSPGRGTTSRRRVLSTESLAPPSSWAIDELLVVLDVSIHAGAPCTAHLGYQRTLEHFLTFVAKRNLFLLNDTQMGTALSIYSNAHYMYHRGNTLMASFMHRYPQYLRHRGGMLPRFH